MRLRITIEELLKNGKVKEYTITYRKKQNETPQRKCNYCNGTGKRNDDLKKDKCNCCNGTGKVDAWIKSYPFSVKNVEDFTKFCKESGGFEIC